MGAFIGVVLILILPIICAATRSYFIEQTTDKEIKNRSMRHWLNSPKTTFIVFFGFLYAIPVLVIIALINEILKLYA